jgi:hypothetical protein
VPDALATGRTKDVKNLGYLVDQGISTCCDDSGALPGFKLEGVDLKSATLARVNLNAWYFTSDRSIEFRFNGRSWHSFSHPFPESMPQTRAVSIPVDLADLRPGQNLLELRTAGVSTQPPLVIANVELEVVPR